MTTHRSNNVSTLVALSCELVARGYAVAPIVVPEIPAVDGVPYLTTSASNRDILEARRAIGA